ncbi:hypothetical protein BHM03_00022790 [Ensete ventricosum]|nr:hypothetical protein BHM03_00022790 [Ensete ventricosum]
MRKVVTKSERSFCICVASMQFPNGERVIDVDIKRYHTTTAPATRHKCSCRVAKGSLSNYVDVDADVKRSSSLIVTLLIHNNHLRPLATSSSATIDDVGFKQEQLILLIDTSHRLKLKGEQHIEGDRWSQFDMVVRIPKHCDVEPITAKFDPDNGLLCVTLLDSASKSPCPTSECRDRRRRLQLKAHFAIHDTSRKAWERLCKLFCLRIEVNDSFKREDSVKR